MRQTYRHIDAEKERKIQRCICTCRETQRCIHTQAQKERERDAHTETQAKRVRDVHRGAETERCAHAQMQRERETCVYTDTEEEERCAYRYRGRETETETETWACINIDGHTQMQRETVRHAHRCRAK